MKIKKIFLLAMIFFVQWQMVSAAVEISDERADANYWTSRIKDGDKLFLTAEEIENFNHNVREKDPYAKNLAEQEEIAYRDELRAMIEKLTEDANLQGTPEVLANRNLDVLKDIDIAVRYGVTVERGNIRLLPQNLSGELYDGLQGTAIDPGEPVAILHESADGRFYFVQSRNYFGWLNNMVVGLTDKETWLTYVKPENFLVVADNKKAVKVGSKDILFQMGAVIPLAKSDAENNFYTARLPQGNNGALKEVQVQIAADNSVHENFLPFTPNNIIRQAFKFLGENYGWGGLENGVDGSAFVSDVYRSMGVEIPRDTSRQSGYLPILSVFNDVTQVERLRIAQDAPTGALLFTPGHVMLKLGNDAASTPVAIHALNNYLDGGKIIFVRKVIASELNFMTASGRTALEDLTDIIFIKET